MIPEELLSASSRFWSKVLPPDENGCMNWTAGTQHGYGYIQAGRKLWRAHRLSWVYANKRLIPDRKVICHSCDNPGCVNPDHLILGTQSDNIQQAYDRGRGRNKFIGKDRCIRGHLFSDDSYITKEGYRACRACRRLRRKRARLARKGMSDE